MLEFTWTSRNGGSGGVGGAGGVRRCRMRAETGFALRQNLHWVISKVVSNGTDEDEHLACPCRVETSGILWR